jgi:NAD(P)-dependent dehydrogenase (short-subunit alcohol dehydrogenase family)
MKLKGKVSVITGAGSGIGKASAELFAAEGSMVLVCDIDAEAGKAAVQGIKNAGGEAAFLKADVARSDDAKRMIDTAVDEYGRLDILFNNAGVAGDALDDTTEEKFRKVIDVNLTGPFLACMYAIPQMREQGGGAIINTGSIGGLQAMGRSPAYTASKGGLIMLTRALARSLAGDNIRANCICPGAVDTGLTDAFMGHPSTEEERRKRQAIRLGRIPMGRAASPEEIASVALFLASDDSAYITGAAVRADGGILA